MLKDIVSRFLLAFLTIETVLQETTVYRRREKLSAIKNGLDLGGAYVATLRRIKAQDGEKARLGMAALMWIAHSRRPLYVDEICHAVAIRIGLNDLNIDDIPAISTLLDCCQGLVTMERGASTVRLIHFTLQEYLCTTPDIFDRPHSTMAEICLTYLNFQHVKDLSISPNPRNTPLLGYSSFYWGIHMRMEPSDGAKASALQLLGEFNSHISAKLLWKSVSKAFVAGYTPRWGFSALHCISYFGIADVANTMIKMNEWDVNQSDGAGVTPLIWAARYGHEEVVRLLLRKKHIEPDQQDMNYGRTALSWAAENGHEGVVRLFLGPRFANPGNIGRWWGKAPRVVGLLFGRRYVNPDSPGIYGRTPLSFAAGDGHEGVVKLLLGRKDVNPDIPDTEYGRTPLSWAAGNGHNGVVKLLLERKDVNPHDSGRVGRTPLSWAAGNGHEGIVKLLLEEKDANPDSSSKSDRTPLSFAAENGHEGIVKVLLGWENVNPDIPDTEYGRTPLSWAAGNGHDGVVKLLLEREDVNPHDSSKVGRTPLSWAAGNGHEEIVKLLLEEKDANPDSSGKYGLTPLLLAAEGGHEGVVKLLLGRKDVNPNSSSESGRTPLSWAAGNGHGGVVELLLRQEDVKPDIPDTEYGRTPLSWAAGGGRERVVKLLLERKDVDLNSSSKSGQTPLMLADANRHDRVVALLQARNSQHVQPGGSDLVSLESSFAGPSNVE